MKSNVNSLFVGEHMRTISVAPPKKGGMRFTTVRLSCLGSEAPITSGAWCAHCKPREVEVYTKNLETVTKLENAYAALCTECQGYMGDVCRDVLCRNGDCPIFYRRRKAQIDLDTVRAKLGRIEALEWWEKDRFFI